MIKEGNLLDATDDIIVHQCNCTTKYAKGLSDQIFTKYPYANDYIGESVRIPGSIRLHGNGKDQRYIINMFAQYQPSKGWNEPRLIWFQECLDKMALALKGYTCSIGFPFGIGAGLAKGVWDDYYKLIQNFAHDNPDLQVNLYKL